MNRDPEISFGEIEETKVVDATHTKSDITKIQHGKPVASKIIIRERHFIPLGNTELAGTILSAHFSDANRLSPSSHIEWQSKKEGYYIVTEFTVLA